MSNFNFVGRYSIYNLDLTVVNASGAVVDADALPTAAFKDWSTNTTVWSRTTAKIATGTYRLTISSAESADPGLFYVIFSYALSGVAQQYRADIEIPSSSSSKYEALPVAYRAIVESVWDRFEDLIDSPIGGPHLMSYAQSNFGRERVAQMMNIAMGTLNTMAQPHSTYAIDDSFPLDQWGPVLEKATVIEVIKHLIRSYVEQPNVSGVSAARFDRRDYMQRWNDVLRIEQAEFASQAEVFKMSNMGLGRGRVLVGGGVFPNIPYTPGARTRWW